MADTSEPAADALSPSFKKEVAFDWQGHRGARGIFPENTIPGFVEALNQGVQTIELDVVITADSQVLVSHEPWISSEICMVMNGDRIQKGKEQTYNIFQMPYPMIRTFDCGSIQAPGFPNQRTLRAFKPLLRQVIRAVFDFSKNRQEKPYFNIELKSHPEWVGTFCPDPGTFVALVLAELKQENALELTSLQSFDPAILKEIKKQLPAMPVSLLVESDANLVQQLESLGFVPEYYSPHYELVTRELVELAHTKNMKIIPWTVNQPEDMKKLIELGVDGIITDYPDKKVAL